MGLCNESMKYFILLYERLHSMKVRFGMNKLTRNSLGESEASSSPTDLLDANTPASARKKMEANQTDNEHEITSEESKKSELERSTHLLFDKLTKKRRVSHRPKKDEIASTIDQFMSRMIESRHADEEQLLKCDIASTRHVCKRIEYLEEIDRITELVEYLPLMIENGFLTEVANWLRPKSETDLPPVLVRSRLLHVINKIPCAHESNRTTFPRMSRRSTVDIIDEQWTGISAEDLLSTGDLGSILMFYSNRKSESYENKLAAFEICERWSSLLLRLSKDPAEEEDERVANDRPRMLHTDTKPLLMPTPDIDYDDPSMLKRKKYVAVGPAPDIKRSGYDSMRHESQVLLRSKAAHEPSTIARSAKRKRSIVTFPD